MLAGLLPISALPATAADPTSGRVGPQAATLMYNGRIGAGTLHATTPTVCAQGANCDVFTLTVDVPDGFYESNQRQLTVRITWPDRSDDFDLYVCPTRALPDPLADASACAKSAGYGGYSETAVVTNPTRGEYRVVAAGFLGTGPYTGRIEFFDPANPPRLDEATPDLTAEGTGTGRLVAGVKFDGGTDLDFEGTLAFVGSYDVDHGGLRVIDVADPRRPRVIGRFDCYGLQNDVGVLGATVVMGFHRGSDCSHGGEGGLRLIDVKDPTRPRQTAFVPIPGGGTHTLTIVGKTGYVYSNPGGAVVQPDGSGRAPITIVDIRHAGRPIVVATFTPPESGCHDMSVAGNRAYCAGDTATHILDITDPVHPRVISTIKNPLIRFHHGAAVSDDGRTLVIADEAAVAPEVPAAIEERLSFLYPTYPQVCDPAGANPSSAFWFYDVSNERQPVLKGWLGNTGRVDAGLWTLECNAHNFNMVPGLSWMVAAHYGGGTAVIDFTDPSKPSVVTRVTPTDADTWSSYYHDGYIYTGDIIRGFDVIEVPELMRACPGRGRGCGKHIPAA